MSHQKRFVTLFILDSLSNQSFIFCSESSGNRQDRVISLHEFMGRRLCDKCDHKNHRGRCKAKRQNQGLWIDPEEQEEQEDSVFKDSK